MCHPVFVLDALKAIGMRVRYLIDYCGEGPKTNIPVSVIRVIAVLD